MTREIKFRAFVFSNKIMANVTGLCYEKKGLCVEILKNENIDSDRKENHIFFWDKKECSLMQYTGLKDKNEKEIYEFDILYRKFGVYGHPKIHLNGEITKKTLYTDEEYFEVKIPEFYYKLQTLKKGYCDGSPQELCSNFEIKGNIYSNPELLEKQK